MKLIDRFEQKIYYSIDGCHYWTGAVNGPGYGSIKVNRKSEPAHRISYILYRGEIPSGLFVCHKCDNPGCVNPHHLFLGTRQDNMDDMIKKNRKADCRGTKNGSSKLTDAQVREIKKTPEFYVYKRYVYKI